VGCQSGLLLVDDHAMAGAQLNAFFSAHMFQIDVRDRAPYNAMQSMVWEGEIA
jgi:hypothetical protein